MDEQCVSVWRCLRNNAGSNRTALAGFEYNHWWGLWGPAAIPANVVDKIEKDVARALATSELTKLFSKIGAEPMNMSSAEFAKFVRNEMESVARIVEEAGIKSE
ncbi:tripartite tricarboxylate transporter substrate-binding protein [Thermodesulfobacteriota bacterium]